MRRREESVQNNLLVKWFFSLSEASYLEQGRHFEEANRSETFSLSSGSDPSQRVQTQPARLHEQLNGLENPFFSFIQKVRHSQVSD